MEEQLRIHQNEVLRQLESKLCDAILALDRAIDTEKQSGAFPQHTVKVKKFRFATFINGRLRKTIDELDKWHAAFDPSWWIIIRMSNPQIDQQLTVQPRASDSTQSIVQLKQLRSAIHNPVEQSHSGLSVFLDSSAIQGKKVPILYSSSLSAQGSDTHTRKLVDQIRPAKSKAPMTSIRDVRDLARVLSKVDPSTFGRKWFAPYIPSTDRCWAAVAIHIYARLT